MKSAEDDNARIVATQVLLRVIEGGQSLSVCLSELAGGMEDLRERKLAKMLSFGVLRWLPRLEVIAAALMDRIPGEKDRDLYIAVLLGLYQLSQLRLPPHAAVAETVAIASARKKPWAKGFINAVLRNFQRQGEKRFRAFEQQPVFLWAHPAWFIRKIRVAYPRDWRGILGSNNRQAPMSLRVNRRNISREKYLQRLTRAGIPATIIPYAESGVELVKGVPVERLPGFYDGDVSVQDGAAQLAAMLLDIRPGQRILDACAAPGGKTAHILEWEPDLASVTAVERDPIRIKRLEEGLERLRLSADLHCEDVATPERWWCGQCFDRILLDAPCSASGVIRRHPDIKLHRTPQDIAHLGAIQARLLAALWRLLRPGGLLLYATCSVFPEENQLQIARFLSNHTNAEEVPIEAAWGKPAVVSAFRTGVEPVEKHYAGRQILPGEAGLDGFYYALLRKGEA